jgi:hypothetical protein
VIVASKKSCVRSRPRPSAFRQLVGALAALVALCATAFPVAAQARVSPGRGIAGVRLGASDATVRARLGRPHRVVPPTWRFGAPLSGTVGFDYRHHVSFISTAARGQRTSRGVGHGSTLRRFRRAYPHARCQRRGARRLCRLSSRLHGRPVSTDFLFRRRLVRIEIYFS